MVGWETETILSFWEMAYFSGAMPGGWACWADWRLGWYIFNPGIRTDPKFLRGDRKPMCEKTETAKGRYRISIPLWWSIIYKNSGWSISSGLVPKHDMIPASSKSFWLNPKGWCISTIQHPLSSIQRPLKDPGIMIQTAIFLTWVFTTPNGSNHMSSLLFGEINPEKNRSSFRSYQS